MVLIEDMNMTTQEVKSNLIIITVCPYITLTKTRVKNDQVAPYIIEGMIGSQYMAKSQG